MICFVYAGHRAAVVSKLAEKKITCFAMKRGRHITRTQWFDALSSQAALAGYYAVQVGAMHLARVVAKIISAAGAIGPARVRVMGLGVAGLERLPPLTAWGAVVEGYEARPDTKEQVVSLVESWLRPAWMHKARAATRVNSLRKRRARWRLC